jgi:hypothetical protein
MVLQDQPALSHTIKSLNLKFNRNITSILTVM